MDGKLTVAGQTYEIDVNKLTNVELIELEKITGMYPQDFGQALLKGSFLAVTGLVYVLQKRREPTTKFDDIKFTADELSFEAEVVEEPGKDESSGSDSP